MRTISTAIVLAVAMIQWGNNFGSHAPVIRRSDVTTLEALNKHNIRMFPKTNRG